ncbi:MAG: efflux RND transporter permease subunit [Gemmatimonadota bacterium]
MVRFSINRPVTIAMSYLALSLLGVLAWRNLPIELLPDTELPRLSVTASWPGSSPETVEAFLTSPLEAAIQQVRGVENILSTSMETAGTGTARIDIEFERETDMEFARLELSERMAAIEEDLPVGVSGPYVQMYVPEAFSRQEREFMRYTITGPYTLEYLATYVNDEIGRELRLIEGVADIRANEGRKRLLELELNEAQVRALGMNLGEIANRIRALEYVKEAGAVSREGMWFPIALRHYADSIPQILNLPVIQDSGRLVRVGDVATLHDTFEEPRGYSRIDGRPAIGFTVLKSPATNTVEVAQRVIARVAELEATLPPGVRLILNSNQSDGIKKQLDDLRSRSLISALIVFAVLVLFLRSFRVAAIAFATIVFSVLITLQLIYFGGFTLNVLTLMGLAMGFGLMIDNSIVVLENIYRRRFAGDSVIEAAEQGTGEVLVPVLGATITNVIVLLPFVYLQGELKIYYVPLAFVVGFAQLASLVVGFTFIPALAARALRSSKFTWGGGSDKRSDPFYKRIYIWFIRRSLRYPWPTVAFCLLLLGGTYYLFQKYVTRGVLWGRFGYGEQTYISIMIRQPRGAELEQTDRIAKFFENKLAEVDFVEQFVATVNPLDANIRVTFPDSIELTDAPVVLKEQLSEHAVAFGGMSISIQGFGPAFSGGGVGGGGSPNYNIKILGYNYEKVREIAEDIALRLKGFSRVREVDTNSATRSFSSDRASQIVITINRQRLGMHGLNVQDVIREISAATRGRTAGSPLRIAGEEVLFEVKLEGNRLMDVVALKELLLPAPTGELVRLGDVATMDERRVLGRIIRENQEYQRLVSYEFRGPNKLGDRVREGVMKHTTLPPGFSLEEDQGYYWSREEQAQIWGVIWFGIILIFMTSATLFESIRQPIIVLLTVPMALIGVFLIFTWTRASFTREAYIGVIMMAGVVVNNAILLVDHVNSLRRREGMELVEALIQGSSERVRPILMTSASTILGMLPLVLFSESADSNIWNALGYAMIGGLASSTILVLTITPALYLLFERRPERKRLARLAPPPDPELQFAGAD